MQNHSSAQGGEFSPLEGSLLARLARVLGLTGLAGLTMASGPCGTCDPEQHACFELTDLESQQAAALAQTGGTGSGDDAGANTGAATGGASGFGGEGEASSDPAATGGHYHVGGTATPSVDPYAYTRMVAASWDPASGCPTAIQFDAISQLNGAAQNWQSLDSNTGSRCCYKTFEKCYGGRPFLVHGSPRVAALAAPESALQSAPEPVSFEHAVAQSFLADALMEHASVASFARLSLRLLALGAPQELVAGSQRASLDELGHATFCFEQATRFSGTQFAAGPLAMSGALEGDSFVDFVTSNLLEGCIGETFAAIRVSEQARRAEDPALRAGLSAIAEDEARHAELAFRILQWCFLLEPDATRAVLGRVVNEASRAPTRVATAADRRWSAAGRLSEAEGEMLDRRTWHETLAPVFGALLSKAHAAQQHAAVALSA